MPKTSMPRYGIKQSGQKSKARKNMPGKTISGEKQLDKMMKLDIKDQPGETSMPLNKKKSKSSWQKGLINSNDEDETIPKMSRPKETIPKMSRPKETIPKTVEQKQDKVRYIDHKASLSGKGCTFPPCFISSVEETTIPVMSNPVNPKEGKEEADVRCLIDIKTLLSSQGHDYLVRIKEGNKVGVSILEGKYVILCCVKDPHQMSYYCQPLDALYSELSRQGIADTFEFVIVTKPDSGFTKAVLNTLFSCFSINCLAIPFSNTQFYQDISDTHRNKTFIVVHPDGTDMEADSDCIFNYGAQSYPFTREHHLNIEHQDDLFRKRIFSSASPPIFAKELLQCDYLSEIGDQNKVIPTSDLDNRPVGLYLYYNGRMMNKFRDIYRKCVDKGLEFRFILVPEPYASYSDPTSLYNQMKQSAVEDSFSSSWLEFPFNDKICGTLGRLVGLLLSDKLIILPHGDHTGDIDGAFVASTYGIDAYPFTKDDIVERKFRYLKSLTLESLLGKSFMSEWQLYNKHVLLLIADMSRCGGDGGTLKQEYPKIRERYPGTEVVLVPLVHIPDSEKYDWLPDKSSPILPADKCDTVIDQITMCKDYVDEYRCRSLISFGKDGKLMSRDCFERLPLSTDDSDSDSESLFEDELRIELRVALKDQMFMYCP